LEFVGGWIRGRLEFVVQVAARSVVAALFGGTVQWRRRVAWPHSDRAVELSVGLKGGQCDFVPVGPDPEKWFIEAGGAGNENRLSRVAWRCTMQLPRLSRFPMFAKPASVAPKMSFRARDLHLSFAMACRSQ